MWKLYEYAIEHGGLPSFFGAEAAQGMRLRLERLFREFWVELAIAIIDVQICGDTALDYGWQEFTLIPKKRSETVTVRQRYVERWKRCAMANGASPFTSPMRIALPISSKGLLNGHTRLPWCNCTQLHEGNGLLPQIVRDLLLQPLAEAGGKFKRFAVADQPDRIRGAFQDGSAVLAGFEVALETRAEVRVDVVIDIVGDLAPGFQTACFHHRHWPVLPVS